jgi:hypothetical protein
MGKRIDKDSKLPRRNLRSMIDADGNVIFVDDGRGWPEPDEPVTNEMASLALRDGPKQAHTIGRYLREVKNPSRHILMIIADMVDPPPGCGEPWCFKFRRPKIGRAKSAQTHAAHRTYGLNVKAHIATGKNLKRAVAEVMDEFGVGRTVVMKGWKLAKDQSDKSR